MFDASTTSPLYLLFSGPTGGSPSTIRGAMARPRKTRRRVGQLSVFCFGFLAPVAQWCPFFDLFFGKGSPLKSTHQKKEWLSTKARVAGQLAVNLWQQFASLPLTEMTVERIQRTLALETDWQPRILPLTQVNPPSQFGTYFR